MLQWSKWQALSCWIFIRAANSSKALGIEKCNSTGDLEILLSSRWNPGGGPKGGASESSDNFVYKTACFDADCVDFEHWTFFIVS